MFRAAFPDARHLLDLFKAVSAVAEPILMPWIALLIMLPPIVPPLLF